MSKSFAWSFSRLSNYEVCGLRYYHYNILKDVVEDTTFSSPGQDTHKAFQLRISEGRKLPLPLAYHEPMLAKLASLPGEILVEQKLALTAAFQPTTFFAHDVWYRTVLDYVNIHPDNKLAIILDYKTGKPGNDVTQLELGGTTVMHYQPEIERVVGKLLYVNHNKAVSVELTRGDIPRVWSNILPRVRALQKAHAEENFPPRPGGLCARWCNVTSCQFHGRKVGDPPRG